MPGSREHKDMLVVPETGMLGALLAEPALRALAAGHPGDLAITVCHEYADLFAGHPAVHALAYAYPDKPEAFDQIITLQAGQGKGTTMDKMLEYAANLGTTPGDNQPKIFLNSFDLLRAQRFGLSKIPHPRLALILPEPMAAEEATAWRDLCRTLTEKLECGIVLLGPDGGRRFEYGRDLRGKLMARETAAVISQCDVLISPDAEMVWVASAVRVPGIFVGCPDIARTDCPGAEQGIVEYAAGPEYVVEALSRLQQQVPPPDATTQDGASE